MVAIAQSEKGFEYSPWENTGQGASTTTFVNDAENRLDISCLPEDYWYIYPYHSVLLMSDDKGNVPDFNWGSTVRKGKVTIYNGSGGVEVFNIEARSDSNSVFPEAMFNIELPNTRKEKKLDTNNKKFVKSIMMADKIYVSLTGRSKTFTASFTGRGSFRAIGKTYCTI